ncbi:MAG: exodeoxyribonuclease VII large subunit, partial [Elusimicrobiaceae bacterium]|nr:exodeoxyribonuclease VII large subunit [Elusimicrobiaceae bacterium]
IAPVLVQGDEAAPQIAKAIADLNKFSPALDVLLVGRGGGSMEDLWAFNEEIVARAIYASNIPVISCVGHEVDFTIADFVADLRAPTPSAAAELVVQNSQNTAQQIANLQKRMLQAVSLFYERFKRRFDLAVNARVFKNPQTLTQEKEQELDELSLRLTNAWTEKLTQFTHRLDVARQKLNALGPQAVLKRGYSITRKADGSVISHVAQTAPGETIYVQVQDGMIHTEVK